MRSQTLANIEKERIKRKITQGQLAMKIGVSHKTYYNWINEVRDIPSRKLQRLAKILDVTMEYLLESSTEIERSRENEKFGMNWILCFRNLKHLKIRKEKRRLRNYVQKLQRAM